MKFKEILVQKKEWQKLQKRARGLPQDYQIVYQEIQKYFLKVIVVNFPTDDPFTEVLDILSEGAARNKDVLEIVGPDVAEFADSFIVGQPLLAETIAEKKADDKVEQAMEKWIQKLK